MFTMGWGDVGRARRRITALIGVVAIGVSLLAMPTAEATLQLLKPSPTDASTFFGNGGYSADGLGQIVAGGTIQTEVPAGSTVVQAYLYGTYFFTSGGPDVTARTIDFDGTVVVLDTLANSEPGICCNLYTARADVTAQVATKVGSGGGITDFTLNNDPAGLDGVALVVLYSNPASPEVTIAVLDGGSKQAGDTVTFNFAAPVDPTTPGFVATMSLGSGFSFQGNGGGHLCEGVQYSTVDVNGSPLTACAGNYDDGEGDNGALITVGGVGDSTDNPADPTTQTGTDDELYNLVPLMNVGDTSLVIETTNPSGDDNLFLAVIAVTAEAAVTTEVCDNGIDDDGDGFIDGADADCAVVPPGTSGVSGTKFYDANTDGVQDLGEPGIEDWVIDVTDGTTTSAATDADGDYTVELAAGTYDVAERAGGGTWHQTAPASGLYDDVVVPADSEVADLDFGNVCVGDGGAHTRGFWQNRNGQTLFATDTSGALALLNGLHLKGATGQDVTFASYSAFKSWLKSASAKNSAYMLSAQLATMALNVHFGLVDPTAMILAVGASSANPAGFSSVQDVIDEADAALAAATPNRSYQLVLSGILDAANNNRTFAQGSPEDCPAPTFGGEAFTLYADGSSACTGADDTTQPTGTATFTPAQDMASFSIDLTGLESGIAYDIVISEDGDCDPVVYNPAGTEFTVPASGNVTFTDSFPMADGTHNLLVNVVATSAPADPKEREITTVDTNVVVL